MDEKNVNYGFNYGHIGDKYILNSRSKSGEVITIRLEVQVATNQVDAIADERRKFMKNAEELYQYCKKNVHTKNWISSIKSEARLCLRDEVPRCNGLYYSSRRIEYDYATDLWLILENKCSEKAFREDMLAVVNEIFQDISNELIKELPLWNSYKIVLCARNCGETVLWLGPSQCAERFLKVYIQSGYDAALASL